MSWPQTALAIAALITVATSWNVSRARFWIYIGAMAFVLSTAWARYHLPYPPWFVGVCDGTICILVLLYAKRKWEMWIGYLFQGSILLSIGSLTGVITSHTAYVIGLEVVNWAALFIINLVVVTAKYGDYEELSGRVAWGALRWAHHALCTQREDPPFWRVKD